MNIYLYNCVIIKLKEEPFLQMSLNMRSIETKIDFPV